MTTHNEQVQFNQWMREMNVSALYAKPEVVELVKEDEAREIRKELFINRLRSATKFLSPKTRRLWVELTR